MGGVNTNATTRLPARQGLTEFEIFTVNDFPDPSGGVITLTSGDYHFKNAITLSDRFEIAEGATVRFIAGTLAYTITYTGTDTFISNVGSTLCQDFRTDQINIVCTGAGAQLFDLGTGFWDLQTTVLIGAGSNQSIGAVQGGVGVLAVLQLTNNQWTGFAYGITFEDSVVVALDGLGLQSTFATGNTMISLGKNITQIDIQNATIIIGPGESAFDVDPALIGTANIDNISLPAFGAFYKTRLTGSISAFADASIGATAITSVTDSSGIARFNYTGSTLYIGQEVVNSTFVTNTTYNGTFIITATGVGYFEVSSIAFGTDETGSFLSNSVTATSTAHGLSEGTSLLVKDSIYYDGGQSIYNVLTNSFQINKTWVIDETATWDTGSLTQMDNRIDASSNPGQLDSTVSAESCVMANVLTTTILATDALTILNVTGAVGTEENRVKVLTDGTIRLDAANQVTLKFDGNVLLEPDNSTKSLTCLFASATPTQTVVTFTNGTNTVNETSTSLADGDIVTFWDNEGTLPIGLTDDVMYYVVNQATNSFQLSYTEGGSVVSFTTDGTGTNTYKGGTTFGSLPTAPIQANNPATLYPQALHTLVPGEKAFIVVKNNQDATDVNIIDSYFRIAE